jgi:hypothetical protein
LGFGDLAAAAKEALQLAAADLLKVVSHKAEGVDQGQNSGFSGRLAEAGVVPADQSAQAGQQAVSGNCGGNSHCNQSHQCRAHFLPVDLGDQSGGGIGAGQSAFSMISRLMKVAQFGGGGPGAGDVVGNEGKGGHWGDFCVQRVRARKGAPKGRQVAEVRGRSEATLDAFSRKALANRRLFACKVVRLVRILQEVFPGLP